MTTLNLFRVGRVFYGVAIVVMGLLTIYRGDFPYMLIPPNHKWIPGLGGIAYISGVLLAAAGLIIVLEKKVRTVSLSLGGVLLAIFTFGFIPYQLTVSPNYMHFGDWENSAKELALASGAFVIAAHYSGKKENPLLQFLSKVIPFGPALFALTIMSFAGDHFLYANEAANYVPSWIPFHLFWIYFTGAALFASGLAIILKVKDGLVATLLGSMILTWFVILHVPRIIVSPAAYLGSEIASAFIALAYSGIAFAIAGMKRKS